MTFHIHNKKENLAYLILWVITFLAPVLALYVGSTSNSEIVFSWSEVLYVWRTYIPFLVLFLMHNFLLAPLLIYQRKRGLYFTVTLSLVAVFTLAQCMSRPDGGGPHGHRNGPPMEMKKMGQPPMEMKKMEQPPMEMTDMERPPLPPDFNEDRPPHHKPPVLIGQHDVMAVVILLLLLGVNLGVKFYFRSEEDRKRIHQMENEQLAQQLEYLKYQINPHFFMNTLNNIHALVDIDPERAKSSIVVLSKMMRYILYESNNKLIPLQCENVFINNYISLMRMRFTEKVQISIDLPDAESAHGEVPPLLLITFVENAFKHGISYQQESFINISAVTKNDRLTFTCTNSKASEPNPEKGGVGLVNVRKRLELIYQNRYTLDIQETDDTYHVTLTIPLS